tara:strand:- start:528 stop:740 length:213 start_codon:yes stop_codon:yes gene_type:complete
MGVKLGRFSDYLLWMSEYKSNTWVNADDPCGQIFFVKGLAMGHIRRYPLIGPSDLMLSWLKTKSTRGEQI